MSIIAFSQLHNELEKGNLENWFNSVNSCCDKIYIYDQGSTDGSLEYYKKFDNTVVISSETNNFKNEIFCKDKLLNLLQEKEGYDNWIFWLDGDTITSSSINKKSLKEITTNTNLNFLKFRHYNLWRSDIFYRVDNSYHGFFNKGAVCLWRNSSTLKYTPVEGLHLQQYPGPQQYIGQEAIIEGYYLIHRGFATDYQLVKKYEIYKQNGMSGWALERLLDETTLDVEELPKILPDWFVVSDNINPINKPKIKHLYLNIPLIYQKEEYFIVGGYSNKFSTMEEAIKFYSKVYK